MDFIPNGISVVIPTYNRAHLIKESLQSVLDQTVQPLEIIVVDDFSTDNTEDVVKSLNSPLIKYFKNQRTKGANGARNTGIILSQGEFIAFHDSDDIWLSDKLEKQLQVLQDQLDVDMCFCSLRQNDKKNTVIPRKKISSENIGHQLLKGNFISTQTIFIRKVKIGSHLFDEELKRFQDWDFILGFKEIKIFHLDIPLVVQDVSGVRISNKVKEIDSYKAIFDKYPMLANKSLYFRIISQKIILNKGFSLVSKIKLVFFLILFFMNKVKNNIKKVFV